VSGCHGRGTDATRLTWFGDVPGWTSIGAYRKQSVTVSVFTAASSGPSSRFSATRSLPNGPSRDGKAKKPIRVTASSLLSVGTVVFGGASGMETAVSSATSRLPLRR
jgi:hypothetical protein